MRDPISAVKLAKLDAFMDKVDFVDRVGPEFELTRVRYASRSDAVAEFHGPGADSDNDGIVIATTDDNWAHASRLLIPWDVADLVDHVPLGRGAVAIKAKSQFGGSSSPPFVLYPDGEVKPLVVTNPAPWTRAPSSSRTSTPSTSPCLCRSTTDSGPSTWTLRRPSRW